MRGLGMALHANPLEAAVLRLIVEVGTRALCISSFSTMRYSRLLILSLLLLPRLILADTYPTPIGCDTFASCICKIIEYAGRIALPLVIVFIVLGGFLFVFSMGSEEKLRRARSTLTWAVIGFIVVLVAIAFANVVKDFLTNSGAVQSCS